MRKMLLPQVMAAENSVPSSSPPGSLVLVLNWHWETPTLRDFQDSALGALCVYRRGVLRTLFSTTC